MKILFLDQSGKPGGAELCLLDIAKAYKKNCMVGLFADGGFRKLLEQNHIPVQVLNNQVIRVSKESSLLKGLASLRQLIPLIFKVAQIAREYNLIYANTQKALVIGALASFFARRPLIYHLHDILSPEHFSATNRHLAVFLANNFSSLVIANSQASKTAFITAGGNSKITEVVYNGFDCTKYNVQCLEIEKIRHKLGVDSQFIIGHFSRLAPWKGQHILIEALTQCPENVTAILVGDALFGEQDYVKQLHQQVETLKLSQRVKFLGFRDDIPQLMAACNLITHTSTAAEPFGRVIVEAMLSRKPVIAAKAGGAMELIEHGVNGFLSTPGNPQELAEIITHCYQNTEKALAIANHACTTAKETFDVNNINQKIIHLLDKLDLQSSKI